MLFNFIDYNMLSQLVFLISYSTVFLLIGIVAYKLYNFDRQIQQRMVKKQAHTDQLTGKGNRYLFNDVVDTLIKKGKKFAICFMDLDGFKQINDTMGHDAGDQLLVELANTFDRKLPKNATAYRLGGDEFAIVIQDVRTTEDITNLLDNLKREFVTPLVIDGTKISLEYSLGVSIYPQDAKTRKELVTSADDAMYYIKEHGKNDYYFHNKVLRAEIENKMKMQSDLKIAYENQNFTFNLKPRIDIKNPSSINFESCLIWNHPVLGEIPASYFVKQAEEINLIIKLDQFILEKSCEKIEIFNENGYKDVRIAVNISNKHALKKDFTDRLYEIIQSHNIKHGQIQIQIMDNIDIRYIESYKFLFERLKSAGADIIINNLELKYDTIYLITHLPIDEIKISSKYLTLDEEKVNHDLLMDICKVASDLKYKVIITGIEDKEALESAISYNVDKIQGDFLFKSMKLDLVEDFLSGYDKFEKTLKDIIAKSSK